MGLDIIGDIHGQADKLLGLLTKLGYSEVNGAWRHPQRQAVFVGDLIDRGPGQLATIRTVQAMVATGAAHIVMGNHEFNAIAMAQAHPKRPGDTLRTRLHHKGADNLRQHDAFLRAVGDGSHLHAELVQWFMTLPLWLELDGVRFIHACWDVQSMAALAPHLGPNRTMTPDLMVTASEHGHAHFYALETLLKGPEVDLPSGRAYLDKENIQRDRARYAWWKPDADTYAAGAVIPPNTTGLDGQPYAPFGDEKIEARPSEPYRDPALLFFGHYWSTPDRLIHTHNALCVDLSAAKQGPLAAYRWDGEAAIDLKKLCTFNTN